MIYFLTVIKLIYLMKLLNPCRYQNSVIKIREYFMDNQSGEGGIAGKESSFAQATEDDARGKGDLRFSNYQGVGKRQHAVVLTAGQSSSEVKSITGGAKTPDDQSADECQDSP